MELKPQGESDGWDRQEGEYGGQKGQHMQGSEVEGNLAAAKVGVKDKHLIHYCIGAPNAYLTRTGQAQ